MESSIQEMCRTKFRFLVTGRSCDPAGKEDPAPLTFEEIRRVLRPYLDKAKFITDLPDGDRLFELTREQLCPEADTDESAL